MKSALKSSKMKNKYKGSKMKNINFSNKEICEIKYFANFCIKNNIVSLEKEIGGQKIFFDSKKNNSIIINKKIINIDELLKEGKKLFEVEVNELIKYCVTYQKAYAISSQEKVDNYEYVQDWFYELKDDDIFYTEVIVGDGMSKSSSVEIV